MTIIITRKPSADMSQHAMMFLLYYIFYYHYHYHYYYYYYYYYRNYSQNWHYYHPRAQTVCRNLPCYCCCCCCCSHNYWLINTIIIIHTHKPSSDTSQHVIMLLCAALNTCDNKKRFIIICDKKYYILHKIFLTFTLVSSYVIKSITYYIKYFLHLHLWQCAKKHSVAARRHARFAGYCPTHTRNTHTHNTHTACAIRRILPNTYCGTVPHSIRHMPDTAQHTHAIRTHTHT